MVVKMQLQMQLFEKVRMTTLENYIKTENQQLKNEKKELLIQKIGKVEVKAIIARRTLIIYTEGNNSFRGLNLVINKTLLANLEKLSKTIRQYL